MRVLRIALVPAYKNGAIPRDITNGLQCTIKYQPKEKTILTSEEIQYLWDRLPDRGAAQLLILLYTGMRASELINQDPSKVYLDKGYMIGGSKTEAGRDRIIPIHPAVADLVRELIVERKDGGPLIYTTLRAHMPKLLPGHSAHDTRHTFITRWKTLRLDDMILANIVGHSMPNVTEAVYTHRDPETLVEEARKFNYENVAIV
jgi:integrase